MSSTAAISSSSSYAQSPAIRVKVISLTSVRSTVAPGRAVYLHDRRKISSATLALRNDALEDPEPALIPEYQSQSGRFITTTPPSPLRGINFWDLIIAAIHLVFVCVQRRFTKGRPRACGGPAFRIMLTVNSRASVPGMGDLRGLPVITGTEVAPLPAAMIDQQ